MRKIFMALAIFSVFTACNSNSKTEETTREVMSIDTSNLYNSGVSTDTGSLSESPEVLPVTTAPKSNTKKASASVKPVKASKPAPSAAPANNENTGTASTGPSEATPEQAEEKKGMSNAAKGAVIGGVGGAVGGAIISKKKGKGAIIGGAVGAAGGYIIGRKKDKKNQADTTK